MGKFLELCEEFNPNNNGDKWELIEFLKSKGIDASLVQNTDMINISIGPKTVSINVSSSEEDESINAGTGTYEVDQEVEKLGNKASSGLRGLAGKAWGTSAQKAKSAVKKRQAVAAKAVDAYDKGTQRIEKGLQQVKQSSIGRTY
jgi:hypothetical protein